MWLVFGAGISGRAAAILLRSRSAEVAVFDEGKLSAETYALLQEHGITLIADRAKVESLLKDGRVTAFVISPGIPFHHPLPALAQQCSVRVLSEIDLAIDGYNGTLIGITGTNGKSTISAMVHHILAMLGYDAALGGNIGVAASTLFSERSAPQFLVLELSSYQIEQSQQLQPKVAIFSNITPDHIKRHGSYDAYIAAKWKLLTSVKGTAAIIGEDVLRESKRLGLTQHSLSSLDVLGREAAAQAITFEGPLWTWHNRLNAYMAAKAVERATLRAWDEITACLPSFRGLRHRCEFVGNLCGKSVWNDSKATNLNSTMVALSNQASPVLLMLGGEGKEEDYRAIMQYKEVIAGLIAFGREGARIEAELKGAVALKVFPTLGAAIRGAVSEVQQFPRPILFSPGCASFDEFANFEERGEFFCAEIKQFLDH